MTLDTARIQIGSLNLGEVVEVSLQDIALQCEVGELALAGDFDEACRLQFFHVVRKRGGANGLSSADIGAGCAATGGDLLEYLVAARVGEGTRNQGELPVGQSNSLSVFHVAKLTVSDTPPVGAEPTLRCPFYLRVPHSFAKNANEWGTRFLLYQLHLLGLGRRDAHSLHPSIG